MRISLIALALATLTFPLTFAYPQTQAKVSCEDLVENFCTDLWTPERLGNQTLKAGEDSFPIVQGESDNGVNRLTEKFYLALKKNRSRLPADIEKAFEQKNVFNRIDQVLGRKAVKQKSDGDLVRTEWSDGLWDDVATSIDIVARRRTEALHPGFIKLPGIEISNDLDWEFDKMHRKVWSDLYVATWQNSKEWQSVKDLFTEVQAAYIEWIGKNPTFSPALKEELLGQMKTVKLMIPGENSEVTHDHGCSVNDVNASYSTVYHQVKVCAGSFNGFHPLNTVAHELGHSIGVMRRVYRHLEKSSYGADLRYMTERACNNNHFSCDEWANFKSKFRKSVSTLKPGIFEDKAHLEMFITKKLEPVPSGKELTRLANREAASSLRREVDGGYLFSTSKKESILRTGKSIPNSGYLNACRVSRWSPTVRLLDWTELQLEMFFTQSYRCELERAGGKETVALKKAIEESRAMTAETWRMLLSLPGKFSYFEVAKDEGYAQDVEENVADAYGAAIVASILRKEPRVDYRRTRFLASIAQYCDAPSLLKKYPEEAAILRSYSNRPHSIGRERRAKLLTREIREVLECRE